MYWHVLCRGASRRRTYTVGWYPGAEAVTLGDADVLRTVGKSIHKCYLLSGENVSSRESAILPTAS